MRKRCRNRNKAFTLAELLICLMIIGEIATFTIPKVLQSQQDIRYKAMAKETIGMISEAYIIYQSKNTPTANTKAADITQYMNYVKVDTTSSIDDLPTLPPSNCDSSYPCLRLHDGSLLSYNTGGPTFAGTASTNATLFWYDPDGVGDGRYQALQIHLYFNGKIRTRGNIDPNTVGQWGTSGPYAPYEPSWFNWN